MLPLRLPAFQTLATFYHCIALKQKALAIYQKSFPNGHPQISVWEEELAWLRAL
jgi:hypothetical protein